MKKTLLLIAATPLLLFYSPQEVRAMSPEDAIVQKMIEMYQLDTASYRVEVITQPIKSADVSKDNLTIRPLSPKEPLGQFTIMVTLNGAGEVNESGQARLKIRKYAEVVVTSDKLRRHDLLTGRKLELKRMEITSLLESPISSVESVIGLRSVRNVRRGTILTGPAVEAIPEAMYGQEIRIIYLSGGCRISTAGIVMQDGFVGDFIKVKNKSSKKIIVARVVDRSAVTVD